MGFVPKHTDFVKSPHTGLSREGWIEAEKYLLEGIFRHIASMDSPVEVPRQETEITYPHAGSSRENRDTERRAEFFEGLTRSLLIAGPLMHCEPEVTVCGFPLRDYYKGQIPSAPFSRPWRPVPW